MARRVHGYLEPGVYSTSLLGTTTELATSDPWVVELAATGVLILKDPEANEEETTRAVLLMRSIGLADAVEAVEGPSGPALSGDPLDLAQFAAAAREILITNERDISLPGASGTVADLALDATGTSGLPGGCGPTSDDRCFMFLASGANEVAHLIVRTSETYRVWTFDQGDEDPIAVFAAAPDNDAAWLDRASALVDGLSFGDPALTRSFGQRVRPGRQASRPMYRPVR